MRCSFACATSAESAPTPRRFAVCSGPRTAPPHLILRWTLATLLGGTVLSGSILAADPPAPTKKTTTTAIARPLTDWHTAATLIKRARQALKDQKLELAEFYVASAEKLPIDWNSGVTRLGDSPQRIRADIVKAKGRAVPQGQPNPQRGDTLVLDAPRTAPPPNGTATLPAESSKNVPANYEQPLPEGPSSTPDMPAPEVPNDMNMSPGSLAEPTSIVDPAGRKGLTVRGSDPGAGESANGDATSRILRQAARIQVAGQNEELPPKAAAPGTQNPPVDLAAWRTKKGHAVGLLAEAKAALDRGDLAMAQKYARTAQELKVPEEAYEQGDPRPWMLLMDIGAQEERLGSASESSPASASTEAFAPPPLANPLQEAYSGYDEISPPRPAASNPPPAAPNYYYPQQYPTVPDPRMAGSVPMMQAVPPGNVMVPMYQAAPYMVQTLPPGMALQGSPQGLIPNGPPTLPVQGTPVMPATIAVQTPTPSPQATTTQTTTTQVAQRGQGVAEQPSAPPSVPKPVVRNNNEQPSTSINSAVETPPDAVPLPRSTSSQVAAAQNAPQSSTETAARRAVPKPIAKTPPRTTERSKPRPELANVLAAALEADAAQLEAPDAVVEDRAGETSPLEPAPMVDLQPPPAPSNAARGTPPRMLVVDSDQEGEGEEARQPLPDVVTPPGTSAGMEFYEAGRQALENHDLAAAKEAFQQAWRFEAEFEPEVRQRLQDHLQMLAAPGGAEEAAASDGTEVAGDRWDQEEPAAGASEAVRQLISEVAKEQAESRLMKESDPSGAWDRLQKLKATVEGAEVEPEVKTPLLARVQREIADMELYIAQNRSRLENDARNKSILEEVERRQQQRTADQAKVAQLVEQFNELMDQRRYPEAVTIAKQARELAPENAVVISMMEKGQIARQVYQGMLRDERFNTNALHQVDDVLDARVPPEGDFGFPNATEWKSLTRDRMKSNERQNNRHISETEIQIQNALRRPMPLDFNNEPLAIAMRKISEEMGINIYVDPEGLAAESITSDQPVSLPKLPQPISLRSALTLMLEPLHLTHMIRDEVLCISSEEAKRGAASTRTYHIADLVIPIPNFVPNNNVGLPGALREAHNLVGQGILAGSLNQLPMGVSQAPLTVSTSNPTMGTGMTNSSVLAQIGSANIPGAPVVGPGNMAAAAAGGGSQADFSTLMNLIQTTIEPDSWEENGGVGNMAPFPTNLSLVVTNTNDVHEKIVELLDQLRRLQDLQVTIEVRFITLNDNFFERIGVDFDFDLDDNTGLTVGQLQQLDDQGPSVTVGLDPFGQVTPDLDIRFTQGSFGSTTPGFGRFDSNSVANLGFAILSDIEAFFLIQAAQGDERSNVLQAPKVTLFDGQTASVSDTSQRPFVTSVIPVVGDFAAAHQPVITVLSEGTTLSVNAVVSNDRRFVRLTLVPFFSRIGNVETFTFDGRTDSDTGTTAINPADDTQVVRNNQRSSMLGTTVQLPTLAFTTVNTTVSVPDGGTIMLGGIKRLSEGRNERGVPMLSKVPYVNRLFKNVGIGRETQSLMLMVTPRIIIQEEEEEKLESGE